MKKITIGEMLNHWHGYSKDPGSLVGRIMEDNITDFVTAVGMASKAYFLNSFAAGGFDGKKWPVRTSKWGKRFTHPLMLDRETLRNSIKEENDELKTHEYQIRTTEKSFAVPKKRGKKKGNDQSYAAVHNTAPEFSDFTVNQRSDRKPEHRQFMGFSTTLDEEISQLIPNIFDRLPNDKG